MRRNIFISVVSLFIGLLLAVPRLFAEDGAEFKKHNPDGKKYEFARSYISGLSYIDGIHKRWQKENPKERYKDDPEKMFQAYVEYLALDNAELRIAKNFLVKYLSGSNDMMRKSSDIFILTCDQLIEANRQERGLWQDFYKARKSDPDHLPAKEKVFVKEQKALNEKRQEISKTFVESALLMTYVMQSENVYVNAPYQLALTDEERRKLVKRLDEFAKDNIDWGIKSGQSAVQASVAAIREVLEDPIWKSASK